MLQKSWDSLCEVVSLYNKSNPEAHIICMGWVNDSFVFEGSETLKKEFCALPEVQSLYKAIMVKEWSTLQIKDLTSSARNTFPEYTSQTTTDSPEVSTQLPVMTMSPDFSSSPVKPIHNSTEITTPHLKTFPSAGIKQHGYFSQEVPKLSGNHSLKGHFSPEITISPRNQSPKVQSSPQITTSHSHSAVLLQPMTVNLDNISKPMSIISELGEEARKERNHFNAVIRHVVKSNDLQSVLDPKFKLAFQQIEELIPNIGELDSNGMTNLRKHITKFISYQKARTGVQKDTILSYQASDLEDFDDESQDYETENYDDIINSLEGESEYVDETSINRSDSCTEQGMVTRSKSHHRSPQYQPSIFYDPPKDNRQKYVFRPVYVDLDSVSKRHSELSEEAKRQRHHYHAVIRKVIESFDMNCVRGSEFQSALKQIKELIPNLDENDPKVIKQIKYSMRKFISYKKIRMGIHESKSQEMMNKKKRALNTCFRLNAEEINALLTKGTEVTLFNGNKLMARATVLHYPAVGNGITKDNENDLVTVQITLKKRLSEMSTMPVENDVREWATDIGRNSIVQWKKENIRPGEAYNEYINLLRSKRRKKRLSLIKGKKKKTSKNTEEEDDDDSFGTDLEQDEEDGGQSDKDDFNDSDDEKEDKRESTVTAAVGGAKDEENSDGDGIKLKCLTEKGDNHLIRVQKQGCKTRKNFCNGSKETGPVNGVEIPSEKTDNVVVMTVESGENDSHDQVIMIVDAMETGEYQINLT